jgi:hypothetical protein
MLAAAGPSVAQTTINMATAKGNCVAVTDAAGLTTAPGGTELRANGVTLTASQPGACNPVGGSSSTFQASVQISGSATPGTPYTPAINTPFYVIWSASTDATTCVRGGNFTTGMTGWTVGSTSGSGSHAEQVTPTAAGNYNFTVTCTNASGHATAAVNVPQPATPAPTPNPITLTVPATATAGVAFAVTWPTMSNAATCKGTGTLGGVAANNLGDWTNLTTVTTSRNVTVPAGSTGSLQLTLTCWNADNSASAIGTSSAIAVSAGSTNACPTTIPSPNPAQPQRTLTLATRSNVTYSIGGTQERQNVDLSEWDNIWGYATATGSQVAWPGPGFALPFLKQFTRDSYLCAHFKTPSAAVAATLTGGTFSSINYSDNPRVVMAISTIPGDFTAGLPTPGCRGDHAYGDPLWRGFPPDDSTILSWKFTVNGPSFYCNLSPETDYYVNLYIADPTEVTAKCLQGSTTCRVGIQH